MIKIKAWSDCRAEIMSYKVTGLWGSGTNYCFGARSRNKYSFGLEENSAEIEKWCDALSSGSGMKIKKAMREGKPLRKAYFVV